MRNPLLFPSVVIFVFISACSKQQPDLELVRLRLENQYRSVGQFDKNTHIATIYDKMQMGYIDVDGKVILPLGEYGTYDFSDGIGIYSQYNKEKNSSTHYAIDKTGTVVKTFEGLNYLKKFENGVAIAGDSTGHYGLMMSTGETKVPFRYKHLERISSKYYEAQDTSGCGVIDVDGKIIVPHVFVMIDHIDTLSMNVWAYKHSVGYGVFKSTGELVKALGKDLEFESFAVEGQHYVQRDGLLLIKNDSTEELSVVNLNFETIVPFGKYPQIHSIHDGRIEVSLKTQTQKIDDRVSISTTTKIGFLDYQGKLVIPADIEDANRYFAEGLCAISKGGKWGYIDRGGELVIPLQYTYCLPFSRGYAKVQLGDKFFIIDKTGKVVLDSKPYW